MDESHLPGQQVLQDAASAAPDACNRLVQARTPGTAFERIIGALEAAGLEGDWHRATAAGPVPAPSRQAAFPGRHGQRVTGFS